VIECAETKCLVAHFCSSRFAYICPFASGLPDGLERVGEMFRFSERERKVYSAPLSNYTLPKLESFVGRTIAALIGISVAGGLAWLTGKVLKKVNRSDD